VTSVKCNTKHSTLAHRSQDRPS